MLVRVTKLFSVAVLSTVFCVSAFAQSAAQPSAGQAPSAGQGQTSGQPEKKVKDRGEYDLFETVRTEQNAQKRLLKVVKLIL